LAALVLVVALAAGIQIGQELPTPVASIEHAHASVASTASIAATPVFQPVPRPWYKRRGWYLFLDGLILSSPFTGAVGLLVLVTDPVWRDRPREGSWLRGDYGEKLRNMMLKRLAFPAVLLFASVTGMATFIAHLLDLIP
jgi:hypothetical protein